MFGRGCGSLDSASLVTLILRLYYSLLCFLNFAPLQSCIMTSESDLIVIGGGIVGLATAYRFLERFPDKTVTVLEKEAEIAKHQTGPQFGRDAYGHLLSARVAQGDELPCGQKGDGGVLHEGEYSVRVVRQDYRRG